MTKSVNRLVASKVFRHFIVGVIVLAGVVAGLIATRSRPPGEQPLEAHAVVPLGKDAGQICRQCVRDHHHVGPPRIPEEKHGRAADGAPVAEFPAPSFADETAQVVGICASQCTLGETATEPTRGIGQPIFPAFDAEDVFVESSALLPRVRNSRIEPCYRHPSERPGETELDDRPTGHVQHDDPHDGQFNPQGSPVLSNLPVCPTALSTRRTRRKRTSEAVGTAAH